VARGSGVQFQKLQRIDRNRIKYAVPFINNKTGFDLTSASMYCITGFCSFLSVAYFLDFKVRSTEEGLIKNKLILRNI
jgi:hypothetical protein